MYSRLAAGALARKKHWKSAQEFDCEEVVAVETVTVSGNLGRVRRGHVNSVLLEVREGFPSFVLIKPTEIKKVRFISIGTPCMSIRTRLHPPCLFLTLDCLSCATDFAVCGVCRAFFCVSDAGAEPP